MILVNADDRVGAVARGGAGQDAGKALEVLGGCNSIAQALARDMERPVSILHGYLLDRSHDDVETIIRMRMEDVDRQRAELGLVFGNESVVSGTLDNRAGNISAFNGGTGSIHHIR